MIYIGLVLIMAAGVLGCLLDDGNEGDKGRG